MTKPFHLMTPAERTANRIAQNRAITEKIAESGKIEKAPQKAPARSTDQYSRATPEDRSKAGPVFIRKVQS
jgi:hypothetical protein